MASAANGGGTKMTLAVAPVAALTASATVLNTGKIEMLAAALAGRDAAHDVGAVGDGTAVAWKVASLPVKPCTSTRVFLCRRSTLIVARRPGHHFLGGVAHAVGYREVQAGVLEDLAAFLDVGALHAHYDRHRFTLSSRAAATTPVARVSQRRMPPKMLIRIALHALVGQVRMRNAFLI